MSTEVDFERTQGMIDAAAQGVIQEEPVIVNYFGLDETHRFYLPDGVQYFEYKTLNEGALSQFQKMTNRNVIVQRGSGDAKMGMDPAGDRHALIEAAVCGWELYRPSVSDKTQMVVIPFNKSTLRNEVLEVFPSKLIADLEKAIRDDNPALRADRTIEDIEKEIADLQEELEEKRRDEVGKSAS